MAAVAFAVFGLIVGSFLNVLILRHGVRPVSGRSSCPSCGRALQWHDLIPVFSWLVLRGKCRYCNNRISLQYPLVELLTAILFALIGISPIPIPMRLLALPISALLIAIAAHDLRHKIIPDAWVWSFNILALLFSLFTIDYLLFSILAGPAVAFPLFALWLVSRGEWMGFGDVKLALGMGWLLGFSYGLIAIFLAFVVGAVVGLLLIFFSSPNFLHRTAKVKINNRYTIKSEVPFGPFLILGTLIVWLIEIYGIQIPFWLLT